MTTQSSADKPSTSEREQFLDWLYEHPNEALSLFWHRPIPAQPARRSYLPPPREIAPWAGIYAPDPQDFFRGVQRKQRNPLEVPDPDEWLRKIAYAAADPGDPWTWRSTGRFEADRVIWKYRYMELQDAGLIIYTEGESRQDRQPEGGPRGTLTDAGRRGAERRAEQRRIRDQAQRELRRLTAAMDGLLHWLSEQDPIGERRSHVDGVLHSGHAIFEDRPLPASLFRLAAEHLQRRGLIRLFREYAGGVEVPGVLFVQITIKGQECVVSGGSVADYPNQRDDRSIINNNIGSVTGNVSLQGKHVSQHFTLTTGLAGDEIASLIRAIVEALPVLGLSEEQAAAVRRNAAVIEGELERGEPNSGLVATMMSRTLEVLTGATSSTLGLLLTGYAKELMKNVGLPIG
ncbi:hypothetical protein [Actinoplanes subtropicus]|uniref:hypothetical protein n=1 Tax=Actinoplanes subtropicus TaxID=543632 RepID=UPI0012F9457A|nr:hypothetical protein [Actinoplanes subtropicus]